MPIELPNTSGFRVVINHEEQYSIWPAGERIPSGWKEEGTTGTRQEALDYINKVWVAMSPKSLRLHRELEMQALIASDGARTLPQMKP